MFENTSARFVQTALIENCAEPGRAPAYPNAPASHETPALASRSICRWKSLKFLSDGPYSAVRLERPV